MSHLFDLKGKTAVALGGNGVLGSSMAKGLAQHGAQVAIVGRNMEKAETVVKEIEADGGTAKAFQGDVSSLDSIESLAADIEAWPGGWDIILNALGTNSATPFLELEMEEWDNIMDVNLKGPVFTTQVLPER